MSTTPDPAAAAEQPESAPEPARAPAPQDAAETDADAAPTPEQPPASPAARPAASKAAARLVFDDPLSRQSSDDTDRGWGERPAGGDSAADLARFLDEKPPHHL
ncbi:hypothetical protein [Streptomyces sp. NPDC048612]|uniref:hypothetical protein n=1 Tax=Streptomyces sp. NPDC048612 TaxID=3365579 RepID=UPI003712CA4F